MIIAIKKEDGITEESDFFSEKITEIIGLCKKIEELFALVEDRQLEGFIKELESFIRCTPLKLIVIGVNKSVKVFIKGEKKPYMEILSPFTEDSLKNAKEIITKLVEKLIK
jgi:hypothetical protein